MKHADLPLPEALQAPGQAPAIPLDGSGLAQLDSAVRVATVSCGNEFAQDPQLLADFFVEARDHLAQIENRVIELEQASAPGDTLNSMFRSFHTLKGLAGFLEFAGIQQVAHDVESLLDKARNSQIVLDSEGIDVVLMGRDVLGAWLDYLEGKRPAPPSSEALNEKLETLGDAPKAGADAPSAAVPAAPTAPTPGAAEASAARGLAAAGGNEGSLVKVHTTKLEYLVDMVGELVIAQAMLRHDPDLTGLAAPRVQRNLAQLTRVTGEVQKTAMAMRMVPIGQLFRRMNRLVRDLAKKAGKQAELEMSGEDVELDRSIVEELADPLVHMVRNSLDHGLETSEQRVAAGKPPTGKLLLKAWHQAGQIMVEVADDGRGLNREKILNKARERGLIGPDEAPPDGEIWDLIFRPGFSTAEQVTEVSGRGVGMDVVRRQVEKLRGRLEVVSEPGKGTRFLMHVPLTLAIIDGLVVGVGSEKFIVPIAAVREMFRPAEENLFTIQGQHEMVQVRGRLLPVVRLHRRFSIRPRSENPCEGLLVVVEAERGTFCLLVDEMAGKQEVVIKSLGPVFRQVTGLAGGAILGDGRVGLILEVAALGNDAWKMDGK